MTRSSAPPDAGDLLNLPLSPSEDAGGQDTGAADQGVLPLAPDTQSPAAEPAPPPTAPGGGLAGQRLRAGLFDFAVIAGVVLVAALGSRLLGVALDLRALPALAAFALSFSFLYHVVPLAFWGRSPGMLLTAIVARDADGATLTMRQVLLRWLAALLTVVALGLPLVLLASGRSLADRLSGSSVSST